MPRLSQADAELVVRCLERVIEEGKVASFEGEGTPPSVKVLARLKTRVEQGRVAAAARGSATTPIRSGPAEHRCERVARAGCDILACGHTHIPYVRRLAGTLEVLAPKTIINAGSVGEPRHGGTEATYAVLDTHSGDVELCEVAYDLEKTLHAMRVREVPTEFVERMRRGQELTGKTKEIFCAC